jgi:hypothetical protein
LAGSSTEYQHSIPDKGHRRLNPLTLIQLAAAYFLRLGLSKESPDMVASKRDDNCCTVSSNFIRAKYWHDTAPLL